MVPSPRAIVPLQKLTFNFVCAQWAGSFVDTHDTSCIASAKFQLNAAWDLASYPSTYSAKGTRTKSLRPNLADETKK